MIVYECTCLLVVILVPKNVMAVCDKIQEEEMQEKFSNCTTKYNKDYRMTVEEGVDDIKAVTCDLMNNMITVCGDIWRFCHDPEEVHGMRMMFVEHLITRNPNSNIEQCESINKFR